MAGEVKVLTDGVQRIVLRAPQDTKTISTKKTILDRLTKSQPQLYPHSYLKNSIKEQTLLEYVEDFRRQFVQLFPHRRPLLLCPMNESKVRKFVSTTIRPSLLPYNDVYDLAPCAEFVADFLTYIPLDEPTKLPDFLPSSSTLLHLPQRTADCLDASIFLVSLLRGAGHAAYVVSGYAPQWITEADQSQVNCPLLDNSAEEARKAREKFELEEAERKKTARFTIPTRPEHKSKYLAAREAEAEIEREKLRKQEEEKNKLIVEKVVDPLHGSRVHVWVLVMRGRRDIPDDVFIEASTGTIYPINNSPYLGIEAVWNEFNYWVNVQKTQVPSQMSYDLSNITNWEYVLIDERRIHNKLQSNVRHSSLTDFDHKDGEEMKEEKEVPPEDQPDSRDILDAPLSWANKIIIDRNTYQSRYPGGNKITKFKKCLVEKYSDYNESLRGLIRRITIYDDDECTKIIEIRETFKHRKDYLRERRSYPLQQRTHCMFDPGRPSGLRDFIVTGERHRMFEFYAGARVDGMIKREERVGEKVIEEYASRDDFLIYRSVAVDTSSSHTLVTRRHKVFSISLGKGSAEQPIRKITEKFARNPKVDAEHDIAKRTHMMMQGTIRLDYHYGDKHITHSRHVIDKADKLDQSETEGPSENSLGSMLRVSSSWTPPSRGEEQEMVARLLQIEKDLTTKVRDRETHMMELVQQLELQQQDVQLEKNIYDMAHEQAKLADSVTDSEQEASEAANKVDYLSPFLAQYPPGKPLTRRQAQQAKEECLGALKERLLERANIIQEHLDEEQQKLHQRQAMFKRQAGAGAGEEFNKFSEQALFRIDILNARRARHEELALKRYVEMDERLNNDPRLAILQQPDGM